MKFVFTVLFIFQILIAFAQRPSEKIISKEQYTSNTKWSCADKHFGYYFVNYSKPLPLQQNIENELKSGVLNVGYTYRYKTSKSLDIGAELAYQNRKSVITKDSLHIFDPIKYYDKIYTYHNSLSASAYLRINISAADYRDLGYFIDFGGLFSYAYGYGTGYFHKNKSISEKLRIKKPDYADPFSYGVFMRAGFNNIALIVSWYEDVWIKDFERNNLNFKRSSLMLGVQMNLYAK